jgi:D-proline reductase (dithiol) PrdB
MSRTITREPWVARQVDSSKFLTPGTRKVVKAWVDREPAHEIPWTPLGKPLRECTVAMVSSGALALRSDTPFDLDGERQNPWWGDPSFRLIPKDATERDVRLYHLHVDTSYAEEDINCILPLERLLELESSGEIGRSAPSHYSFMGFLLDPREFVKASVPAMIARMKEERVDVAILVPV